MKKYWFYLESYIYVKFLDFEIFLYNTKTGTSIQSSNIEGIKIVKRIYEDESLGCIDLTEEDFLRPDVHEFVKQIVDLQMGNLVDIQEESEKPIVLLPIVSLNRDIEKLQKRDEMDSELVHNLAPYLLSATIKLNDICFQKCNYCHCFYKQFQCCSSKGDGTMNEKILLTILTQLNYFPTQVINFIGGNIYYYDGMSIIRKFVWSSPKKIHFYIHYLNYVKDNYVDSMNLHLLITPPIDLDKIKEVIAQTNSLSVTYHLIFEDEFQYRSMTNCLKLFGIDNYKVHPFFTGNNHSFFENNVYMTNEDILCKTISMREIYRNQKLNATFFGNLYFFPDGTIKAHPDREVVGNINNGKIIDAIYSEMTMNTAWREIRNGTPCLACPYQFLCPPISSYEHVIGKNDLCDNG